MARPHQQYSWASGQPVSRRADGRPGGAPADVIELIMADHRRIRRFREVLDDAVRGGPASGSGWMLAHVWERVTDLLDSHTQAEEEICYLSMFGPGSRLGEWRRDAVADHDDIREAIEEALLQPVGSALWWTAARAALAVSADHLDREERDMMVSWLPRLTMRRRLELGRQWLGFVAARRLELAPDGDLARRAPFKDCPRRAN
jgi:hypothetical protein